MNRTINEQPSAAVKQDSAEQKAPDPRRHYDSPENLAEDIELGAAERQVLLVEWKYDLEQRLGGEAEGLGASEPVAAAENARLSAELRRVSQALQTISSELDQADAVTGAHGDA